MKTILTARRALTPAGWMPNAAVMVEDGRIAAVQPTEGPCQYDALVPGFVDSHIHGGDRFDVMRPTAEGLAAWLLKLASHGVTGVLAGVYTAEIARMRECVEFYAEAMRLQARGEYPGARVLGVHLEGPFISRERLGAMNEADVLAPSVAAFREIVGDREDAVRLIALAPEAEGSGELIAYCLSRGIRVSAGHSDATAEQARAGFRMGVGGVTHFYNAARPIRHRDPGLLTEALLTPGVYAEAICDLQHVHAEALRLLYAAKGAGRMMVISDGVPTTGLPDGEYPSDDPASEGVYIVKNGAAHIASGALAGGGVYADGAARNLISIGVPSQEALRMASQTPCEWLGCADRGILRGGARADLAALDGEYAVVACWTAGELAYDRNGGHGA